jgi:uncharacterized SAM-binding protein YcdF (DUF218 family)
MERDDRTAQSRPVNSRRIRDRRQVVNRGSLVNNLFVLLGIESWKPVLTALVLPPVPLLLMVLFGARLMLPRRGLGWFVILTSLALLWLTACAGTARLLSEFVLRPPAAMNASRVKDLKTLPRNATAIVILGGGMEPFAPEYGVSNLQHASLERLRYGISLARQTGLPIAFSGGIGWGQPDAQPEARIAAQIAASEFGHPLKWVEENSRDTHENAVRSMAILRPAGVRHIVLVTHGWHMPRALKDFEMAAGSDVRIEAAPMGLAKHTEQAALTWIPSATGQYAVRMILRELLGRLAGA